MHPDGYRKALRIMKLAEKHKIPVITLIDTPGAYPGIGAEERCQAQAIADNLFHMSTLSVPIISIVIGEGASGGALAIGLADKIFCLENTLIAAPPCKKFKTIWSCQCFKNRSDCNDKRSRSI